MKVIEIFFSEKLIIYQSKCKLTENSFQVERYLDKGLSIKSTLLSILHGILIYETDVMNHLNMCGYLVYRQTGIERNIQGCFILSACRQCRLMSEIFLTNAIKQKGVSFFL